MCLVAGAVSAIITTNYDLAFDSCLMPHRHVVTTITEEAESEEFLSGPRHTRAYFKIHGSAEPGKEHTLAFTLGHEGLLDPWKRGLLRELLYGRCLIVLGYSGRDWEICPELARSTQPTAVYWLRRGRSSQAKELSSNARRVLRR